MKTRNSARLLTALGLATLAAISGLPTTAAAAPIYLVDATIDGMPPDPSLSNDAFFFTYEDLNYDMKASIAEVLAFTGVTSPIGSFFDVFVDLPGLPGLDGSGPNWVFRDSTGMSPNYVASAATYTPFTTLLVPEPGGAALLAAVAALGAITSRRRRAAC